MTGLTKLGFEGSRRVEKFASQVAALELSLEFLTAPSTGQLRRCPEAFFAEELGDLNQLANRDFRVIGGLDAGNQEK